jgi:hypothetical protein
MKRTVCYAMGICLLSSSSFALDCRKIQSQDKAKQFLVTQENKDARRYVYECIGQTKLLRILSADEPNRARSFRLSLDANATENAALVLSNLIADSQKK